MPSGFNRAFHVLNWGFFGLDDDVFVLKVVVNMYAKCGYVEDAHKVFDKITKRGLVSRRS